MRCLKHRTDGSVQIAQKAFTKMGSTEGQGGRISVVLLNSIKFIFIFLLLVSPSLAWEQISGPYVSIQDSQFISPKVFQLEEINIITDGFHTTIPLLPSEISGEPFYGMAIESIRGNENRLDVTTTGAVYKISRTGIEMIRRIDPATNGYSPRTVARISFPSDIGTLKVFGGTSQKCTILGEHMGFEIYSDSMMLVSHCDCCPDTLPTFSYTYHNLITDAPRKCGPFTERFWTDGYGGSLHARNPMVYGIYNTSNLTEDSFTIELGITGGSVVAVFPPKQFDFAALYGADARPHVWFAAGNIDYTEANMDKLRSQGFGMIMIWASLYNGIETGLVTKNEMPIYDEDEFGKRSNYRYEWSDPEQIEQAITTFHSAGFKVICYLQGGFFSSVQDKKITLNFMKIFQDTWDLDGWYFDNAYGGKNWLDSYLFMKMARRDVGDDGIIYHHDSVDLWAGLARDGRSFVPVDAYVNYTLRGETGSESETIHDPNHPYLRYYSTGYGFSQAFGGHKLASNGKPSLSMNDQRRMDAQNLNGVSRSSKGKKELVWDNYYEPAYLQKKAEYLAETLSPDISHPADWWFSPTNVTIDVTANNATIHWNTHLPADSNVRHTTVEDHYFYTNGYTDTFQTLNHSITIPDLDSAQEYQYAIRSTDGDRVWGYYGSFTTASLP